MKIPEGTDEISAKLFRGEGVVVYSDKDETPNVEIVDASLVIVGDPEEDAPSTS